MALTFMRHPAPEVGPGICYGRTDLALLPGWERACDALDLAPAAIHASPLSRCRLPAERYSARLGLPLRIDPDLAEMDFGAWEGRPWSDLPRAEIDAWAADFHHARPHGGESVAMLTRRVRRALERVPDGALILAHAGVLKAAMHLRGADDPWRARIGFGETRSI